MSDPTPENYARAIAILGTARPNLSHEVGVAFDAAERRGRDASRDLLADEIEEHFNRGWRAGDRDMAVRIAAAELRGHTRAVEETAILSIHKAVAAERAAVVKRLREWASVGRVATADDYANEIERGDHCEEPPTPPR